MNDNQALWIRLRAAGVVEGDLPAADTGLTPWYIRVMLGIAGWIGAVFLLGFLLLAFEDLLDSAPAAVIVGAMLATAAVGVFRTLSSEFAAQFALAASLAGQILMVFGLLDLLHQQEITVAVVMLWVELILFLAAPAFVHRVWTATMAAVALLFVLREAGVITLAAPLLLGLAVVVWRNEFRLIRYGDGIRALGYGLVLALLWAMFLTGREGLHLFLDRGGLALYDPTSGGQAGALAIALLATLNSWLLLRDAGIGFATRTGRVLLLVAAVIALVSLRAPGVGVSTSILLLGFAHANRVLAGLGVIGLLAYLGHYYYATEMTLMEKSYWLMGTGTVLIGVRWLLNRVWRHVPGKVDV